MKALAARIALRCGLPQGTVFTRLAKDLSVMIAKGNAEMLTRRMTCSYTASLPRAWGVPPEASPEVAQYDASVYTGREYVQRLTPACRTAARTGWVREVRGCGAGLG